MKQIVYAANRKIGLQVVFNPATRIIGQSHFPYLIHIHRVRKAAQSSFSFQPFSSSCPAQQGSPYTPVSRARLKPSLLRIHALDEVGLASAGSVDRGGSGDVGLAGAAGHGVRDTTEHGSQPSHGDLLKRESIVCSSAELEQLGVTYVVAADLLAGNVVVSDTSHCD